jgi:hypothetical protein
MDDDSSLHFHVLQWASIQYHSYEGSTQREHKTQAKKSFSNCSLYAFQRKPLEPSAKGLLLGSKEPLTKKKGKRKRLSLSLY